MESPPPSPLPAYLARVTETLDPVEIRNPSRPGDRCASVLLPIIDRAPIDAASLRDPTPHLLGIVRTDQGRHGGQFSLPGGKPEPHDESSWATAVRETREELGLEHPIEQLGRLGEFNTVVSRFRVLVHVAYLPTPQRWTMQESEVDAALEIPLALLVDRFRAIPPVDDVWNLPIEAGFEIDAEPYCVTGKIPPRGRGHRIETQSGPREMPYIWGLTARILYAFLGRVWIPAIER